MEGVKLEGEQEDSLYIQLLVYKDIELEREDNKICAWQQLIVL